MFCRAFYYCARSTTGKHFSPFAFPLRFHVRLHHGEFFTSFSCDYNKFTFDCALPTWKVSRFVTMCKFMCVRCFSITWALFYVVNVPQPPPKADSSSNGCEIWNLFRLLLLLFFPWLKHEKYLKAYVYSIIACLCLSNASKSDVMKA